MKRKTILCAIVVSTLTSITSLSGKSLMPGLARLKNKVEDALNGPKASFKDFLEKAKNSGNQIFINGKSADSLKAKAFEDEINEIDAIFNNLYWCKQEDFAKELYQAQLCQAQSCQAQFCQSTKILSLLKNKFKEKYPNAKSPLITFANDLSQESETLMAVKVKIEKAMSPVKQFRDLEKKYIEFAQTTEKYMNTLNSIIKSTDSL